MGGDDGARGWLAAQGTTWRCEHGSLQRACPVCEAAWERHRADAAEARVAELEADRGEILGLEIGLVERDEWKARAARLEAVLRHHLRCGGETSGLLAICLRGDCPEAGTKPGLRCRLWPERNEVEP